MAKKNKEDTGDIMFDSMPGFEEDPDMPTDELDLNFDDVDGDDDDDEDVASATDGDDEGGDEEDEGDEEGEESSEDEEKEEEDDPEGDEGDKGDEEDEGEKDEGEDEGDKDGGKEKSEPMVPKSRLDQVLARARKAEEQLRAQAKQEAEANPADDGEAYDFDAKEREYQELVLEGEADKAVALRKEIRAEERKLFTQDATKQTSQTNTQARIQEKLLEVAAEIEAEYPVFDPNSPTYNEALTDEVMDLRDGFINSGKHTAIGALSKAVEVVAKMNNLKSVSEEAESAKEQIKGGKKPGKKTVAEKVKAANQQPSQMPGKRGENRDAKIDIASMTEEQFDALPESTLRELRGDVF